jgi:hypothetical protein
MASHQTIEITTRLKTDDIRRQVEALADSFERTAAELRAGLTTLDQIDHAHAPESVPGTHTTPQAPETPPAANHGALTAPEDGDA